MMKFLAMLLRQAWAWGTFPHALLVCFSLWAVHIQMTYRVPSAMLFLVLPWIGVALSCLSLLIFINRLILRPHPGLLGAMLRQIERHVLLVGLALITLSALVPVWLAARWLLPLYLWGTLVLAYIVLVTFLARLTAPAPSSPVRRLFDRMERLALGLVGGFVLYSFVLFLNGTLDTSEPVEHKSQILDIRGAEVEIGWLLPYSWADLQSWRRSGGTERVFLTWSERRRTWPGQAVLVQVYKGSLGIPWVKTVARDEEKYYRQVLAVAPTAVEPRKELIHSYLERRLWKEAAAAGQEYLQYYPNDYDFIRGVASALGVARQYDGAIPLLEHFVVCQPNYEILILTGWVMHLSGQSARGIPLLESSIPLEPGNWWAYYHLGYAYRDVGRLQEALAMFQKVLERRPNYPEVEEQLQLLRQRLKQPPPAPAR